MRSRASVLVMLAAVCVFLLSYAFVFPNRTENSENRTLATFDMVFRPEKDSVVYHDSPVERLEAAMSDQFLFREGAVNRYLNILNTSDNLTRSLAGLDTDYSKQEYTFQSVGSYCLIENTGYVMGFPSTEPYNRKRVAKHAGQIGTIQSMIPEMKAYVYFVTQASDTSWFDKYLGTTTPDHYEEIRSALPDGVKSGRLVFSDLEDYMNVHFKTDHHWNHRGARRGYEDVYAMMSGDFDPGERLEPVSEFRASEEGGFVYLGSYGRSLGDMYTYGYDDFSFYEYDFPERDCLVADPSTLEETKVEKIGLYDEYRQGDVSRSVGTDHYIRMYGTAVDSEGNRYNDSDYVFVIRNGEGNGRNLLICGDSYGRALRDPLASNFSTTVYIDYRIIEQVPAEQLLERYGIDTLLICSNSGMWNLAKSCFKLGEGK